MFNGKRIDKLEREMLGIESHIRAVREAYSESIENLKIEVYGKKYPIPASFIHSDVVGLRVKIEKLESENQMLKDYLGVEVKHEPERTYLVKKEKKGRG